MRTKDHSPSAASYTSGLLLICIVICLSLLVYLSQNEILVDLHRSLRIESPVVDRGNAYWVENKTVHAVILSTGCDFNSSGQSKYKHFFANFPVPLITWTKIHTKVCPHYIRGSHRVEKGYSLTHLQALMEFHFFDNDVDEARFRKVPEYVTSTTYSSVSGSFLALANGTLYKNQLVFRKSDILLVFEDNIDLIINATEASIFDMLRIELTQMKVDVLSLGSCLSSDQQLCTNAYAITRHGAKVVSQYFDVCGNKMSSQISKMANNKLITIGKSSNYFFREGLCTK